MSNLLLLILFFPLLPIVILSILPLDDKKTKWFSFISMVIHFVISLPIYYYFNAERADFQFETNFPLISSWGANFHIAVDGINLLLILLTTFLGPIVTLGSFHAIKKSQRFFHSMIFLLQFFMLGTFMAQNLFIFYLFWEAMIIPMFFIIGIWGGERRIYSTVKFFLYTALGSIVMLVAILWLLQAYIFKAGSANLEFIELYRLAIPFDAQIWLFAAFFISFAIKVPLFPFHTWLPDAHVEAPTPGSVVLAGILLKMGTYGIIKLAFPLFPQAAVYLSPSIAILAVVSIIYGALLALSHGDIKKIIACSSISHLGFVVLGLVSFNLIGNQGAMIQMISHGFTAGGLFLIVGMIYERMHTRELSAFGGIAHTMPQYSTLTLLIVLGAIGLPGTSGFTGEFLVLFGYFNSAIQELKLAQNYLPIVLSILSITGVVLGALYMLRFVQHFLFGKMNAQTEKLKDLDLREKCLLISLVAMIFTFGIYPKPFMDKIEKSVEHYIQMTTRK